MPYHRATILVIDDDATIRDLAAEALRDEGYAAVAVARHDAARRALRERPVDLVLADPAGVGGGDPWPALDALREAAGDTPVLIFSARAPSALAGYAARGFAGLVTKPFDLDELLTVVRDILLERAQG